MSYRPFIVAGMPRTGSSLLVSTLQQNPDISVYAELFHPVLRERSGPHAIRREGAALYFDPERADPIGFLRRWVWPDTNAGYRAIGFKIFAEYVRSKSTGRLLERLKEEIGGLRVVHMRRTNYFDVYLSRLVANKTGRWMSYGEDVSSDEGTRNVRLMISPEAAERFFSAMGRADAFIEGLFRGESYLRVDYRSLCQNIQEQANVVFDFLGVERKPVESVIRKQVVAPKEDMVVNYDELLRRFAGSPFEPFFAPGDADSGSAGGGDEEEGGLASNTWPPYRRQPDGSPSPDLLESLDKEISGVIRGALAMQSPPNPPIHAFLPREPEVLRTAPRLPGARGNLEKVNGLPAPENSTLWRGAVALFSGWCFAPEAGRNRVDSRYFFLERDEGKARHYVLVPVRTQRDDVAEAFPELPSWVTGFSGFDFYADLRRLEPAEYRLGVVHEAGDFCYEFLFPNRLVLVS